jgi:hypothetical protein
MGLVAVWLAGLSVVLFFFAQRYVPAVDPWYWSIDVVSLVGSVLFLSINMYAAMQGRYDGDKSPSLPLFTHLFVAGPDKRPWLFAALCALLAGYIAVLCYVLLSYGRVAFRSDFDCTLATSDGGRERTLGELERDRPQVYLVRWGKPLVACRNAELRKGQAKDIEVRFGGIFADQQRVYFNDQAAPRILVPDRR